MGAEFSFDAFNPERLMASVTAWVDTTFDAAAGEMAEIGRRAAERMQGMILDAETPTGRARVEAGGTYAGRYDEGHFYNAVDYDIHVDREERLIVVRFGWLHEWRDYFAAQEYGTERIAAVGALGDTYTWGVAQLANVLRGMA